MTTALIAPPACFSYWIMHWAMRIAVSGQALSRLSSHGRGDGMAKTPAANHDSTVQPWTTLQFFMDLFPSDTDGWLTIFTTDRHTKWFPTKSLKPAANYALQQATVQNVWFGVGLRRERLKDGRWGKDDIISLPAFVADIDLKPRFKG